MAVKRLWTLILLAACAVFLGPAACGGGDDDNGSTATATATANVTASPEATEEETDAPTDTADSGDGSDYYNQIADVLNGADQDSAAIAEQYGGPYDDAADEIDQTTSAFSETGQVIESVLLALSDLDPPSEAEAAHEAYFDSLQSVAILFADALADLEDVSGEGDLTAFKNQYSPQLTDGNDAVEAKCVVLQGLADDAGSDADLGCSVQN